jgi:hypothetical protein
LSFKLYVIINYAWVNPTDGGHVGDSHEIVCDFTQTFLGSCVFWPDLGVAAFNVPQA